MKKSEIEKIRNKSVQSLKKELRDSKEELSELRFDLTVGKVKNVRKIRKLKKKIARLLTFINQRKSN